MTPPNPAVAMVAIDPSKPILLYNDECGVCRKISRWVLKRAKTESGEASIIELPIGEDPNALKIISPKLSIWDAYATIHLVMPDGSLKLGGEAVAEVLRNIPRTKWFAWTFAVSFLGVRPFQLILNMAYAILADIRPWFGCESCGTPGFWTKPIRRVVQWMSGNEEPTRVHFSVTSVK